MASWVCRQSDYARSAPVVKVMSFCQIGVVRLTMPDRQVSSIGHRGDHVGATILGSKGLGLF